MIRIPAGTFQMGSPETEEGRDSEEVLHDVAVSAFELAETEVTQEQYRALVGRSPSEKGCAGCPVTNVSWLDAVHYCNALSRMEKLPEVARCYAEGGESVTWKPGCTGYRLPAEAEWEYAARGGDKGLVYVGTSKPEEVCRHGNVADASSEKKHQALPPFFPCDDGYDDLSPVKRFLKNGFGLYDMGGNVVEWVWDWYGPYDASEATDPIGPSTATGPARGVRGGSWNSYPRDARVAARTRYMPSIRGPILGFRVARSLPAAP